MEEMEVLRRSMIFGAIFVWKEKGYKYNATKLDFYLCSENLIIL